MLWWFCNNQATNQTLKSIVVHYLEYYKDGFKLYLNTGWSSSLNGYNRRLLTQEADLVTTHGTINF